MEVLVCPNRTASPDEAILGWRRRGEKDDSDEIRGVCRVVEAVWWSEDDSADFAHDEGPYS